MRCVCVVQLNGVELGWVLGMMINMTTVVPVPSGVEPLSLPVFVLLVILFAVFLLISVGFFLHACKRRHLTYEVRDVSLFGASFYGY